MTKHRIGMIAPLALLLTLASACPPGASAAEPRRRGGERQEARNPAVDEAGRVEQAAEAAERAGVGRRELRELRELCERGEFSESQEVRILNLAAQLALAGLPVESFAAKIGEGVSKRAGADRILQVAERRALLLNQARTILNGILLDGAPVRDREKLIPDVAEALEAGQAAEQVRAGLVEGFNAGESIGEIRGRIFP